MEEKETRTKEVAAAGEGDAQERAKRKAASRLTLVTLGVCTAVILGYVIYGIVSGNMNMLIFEILLIVFVLAYLFMSDVMEPWKLGQLEDLSAERRQAFLKMIGMDVLGAGSLIYWIAGLDSESDGMGSIFPLLIYFLCVQIKRRFRAEFEGTALQADEAEETADEEPQAGEAEETVEGLPQADENEESPEEAPEEPAEASAASAEEKPE